MRAARAVREINDSRLWRMRDLPISVLTMRPAALLAPLE